MKTLLITPIAALLLSLSSSAQASLEYYLPFDNNAGGTLQNDGSIGGTAVSNVGPYGATAPTVSNAQVVSSIGSTYSEYFPITSNRGGSLSLPSSTDQFRLASSSDKMTLSTWVYWGGGEAGIVNTRPSNEATGWKLYIQTDGTLKFKWNTNTGNELSLISSSSVLSVGQWAQVTMTWDCSSTDPLKYYVNGNLVTLAAHGAMNGVMNTQLEDISLGVGTHAPNAPTNSGGYQPLNGYLDDFAMWNTTLSAGKIKALNTAPGLLTGYDIGVMDSLFSLYDSASGTVTVDGLQWSYASSFDTTGRSIGDTWTDAGKDYIWLDSTSGVSSGLVAVAVPEPKTAGFLLSGAGVVLLLTHRRRARVNS